MSSRHATRRSGEREQAPIARLERLVPRTSKEWVAGYPDLVAQWHPTKNATLYPEDVSYGSQRRVWWKCSEGPDHEWRAVVGSRTSYGYGCPFCAGQRVSTTNSLSTRVPAVASEWHPTKNAGVSPVDVAWSSGAKVWWKCPRGEDHEWRATVNARTSAKTGCPFCTGQRLSVTNSIAAAAPDLAAQWDASRNERAPSDVSISSTRKVWWRCASGPDHVWDASPSERARHRLGCPFCAGRRVSITNSLAARHPAIAREWHPTLNGALTAHDVTRGAARRVYWQCARDPQHAWRSAVNNRTTKGAGCPRCRRSSPSL